MALRIIIRLLITLLFLWLPSIYESNTPFTHNGARQVTRVIDGDTLVLDPNEKVRLIGVDTPETKHPKKPVDCFGQAAKEFTTKMVSGKKVRLEFDEVNTTLGHRDRYGRTLAYVYLDDGSFLMPRLSAKVMAMPTLVFPSAIWSNSAAWSDRPERRAWGSGRIVMGGDF